MLNRLVAVLILSVLLSSNFTSFFVYAGFQLNKEYIARNLCINKSRPWMHCNGRCYFMRKIKQAEEEDKKQEAKDNLTRIGLSFFQQPFQIKFASPKILKTCKPVCGLYSYYYTNNYTDTIFRPPKQNI